MLNLFLYQYDSDSCDIYSTRGGYKLARPPKGGAKKANKKDHKPKDIEPKDEKECAEIECGQEECAEESEACCMHENSVHSEDQEDSETSTTQEEQ